jgi:hypothetical protein
MTAHGSSSSPHVRRRRSRGDDLEETLVPNGDRVLITGSGQASSVAVMAPDGSDVPAVRYASSKPAVIPHFPMDIVQINGTGMDGNAANGFTFLTSYTID